MLELIPITRSGEPEEPLPTLLPEYAGIFSATAALYARTGYVPPWIGYVATMDGACVGTCAFKSPPSDGRVELAYHTFVEYEGRGIGTRLARELIRIAEVALPGVVVFAFTLPEENPSTTILRKLGFSLLGPRVHPEDGEVWEWELPVAEKTVELSGGHAVQKM